MSLLDVIVQYSIKNVYSILDYIPEKEIILNELAKQKKFYPEPEDILETIERLLEEKKIEVNVEEVIKRVVANGEELQFPYKVGLSVLGFIAKSKDESLSSFEKFKQELMKTNYSSYVLKYPEIIRKIYEAITLYVQQ
ncbi:MAG: hypothetical protein JTT12_05595 [Candidatus Brockarchaeota archaeon]|nr:hypothetical protein [Candidatus Brockarchaeota archaeon]